ncbi:MAG: AmmeMemoRadiSam system protein B [bacterium]
MGSKIDSDKVRQPAVSGQFYPGDPDNLQTQVESYLKPVPPLPGVIGAVIPHAGYIYSGAVAGETVSVLSVPDRVLILGPNHTGWGPEISVFSGRSWQMPFGEVRIDVDLADQILEYAPGSTADILAHSQEHSIEVLLPFLYYARAEEFTFVPVTISHISSEACRDLGFSLARIIESSGEDILVVASSDMTHFESHSSAAEKDGAAIERILDLDPDGLINIVSTRKISMCGIMPTAVMLHLASALGASRAKLIKYNTSGEVSGDYNQVVGYAGIVVHK